MFGMNCMVGTLPKSKFLDTNQGLPCKQAFSGTRVETCDMNCCLHSRGSWLVPLTVLPGTVDSSVGVQSFRAVMRCLGAHMPPVKEEAAGSHSCCLQPLKVQVLGESITIPRDSKLC